MEPENQIVSICDRADSALVEVDNDLHQIHMLLPSYRYNFVGLVAHGYAAINSLRDDFKSLATFLGCIFKWSFAYKSATAAGDQNFESLVINVESLITNYGNQLNKLACDWKQQSESLWTVFRKHRLKSLYLRLFSLSEAFKKEIEPVMKQISRVSRSLLNRDSSFPCPSPMDDFYRWQKFAESVGEKLRAMGSENSHFEPKLEVNGLAERLRLVILLMDYLAADPSVPLQDMMIHVGSVVVTAGLVFLRCWNWTDVSDMANGINCTNLLSDLRRKIEFTTPEFADMILRLLKTLWTTTNDKALKLVDWSVVHLLPDTVPEELGKYASHSNLKSLITSVFNLPVSEENAQRFLTEVRIVVVEVASLQYSLQHHGTGDGDSSVLLNSLAKIWLLEAEIFLREQLMTTQEILSTERVTNYFNQGIRYLDIEEGHKVITRGIQDSAEEGTEYLKQILTLIEEMASVEATLNHFQAKEMRRKMVRNLLLLKIVLFKAESLFVKLHGNNESSLGMANDKKETINEVLRFLTSFVRNPPEEAIKDGNMVSTRIDAVASGLISFCYSFSQNNMIEEKINHTSHLLATLLDEIKLVMVEFKESYLHDPRSNSPKTNALEFIDSLLKKLRELLNNRADLSASVKHKLEEISGDLEFFKSFLMDIKSQDTETLKCEHLVSNVVDVAYHADYLIDSIAAQNEAQWKNWLWLCRSVEDIRIVKIQAAEVCEKKKHDAQLYNVTQSSTQMMPEAVKPITQEAMVGLNDEENSIIDQLIGGYEQRDVVSIIGMPGIGKTTLAKKVFNNPDAIYHFHIRAWCTVSQVFRKRELLLDILSHITALTENILAMTVEDLELKLYQHLKQKRYLIVMDDLWSTQAWDDLKSSFPNDGNGSRIMITSRLHDVALRAKAHSDPHPLRLLSDAESWNLLQMKIFHGECCPEELIETGIQIAKSCKGLPLAIVAIAGLLQRTVRQQGWWKKIAENLRSQLVDDPRQQCIRILELSYKHLPDYLKTCFLYFGIFHEDEDIPVTKLIRLWIAEDFVKEIETKSLEDLSEDYLKDLIDQSLVIFSKPKSRGGVKKCRVHDMLRNLCQSKAQEDNFLRLITRLDESDASMDALDYDIGLNYSNLTNSAKYDEYRVCISSKRRHFALSRPSGTRVRSLLFFATSDKYPRCPYDVSFISHNFKFIRVLDLECINMGSSFPNGIELLVHLRYLAISGDLDFIPSSVDKLKTLETFIVKGLKGKVELPDAFWCLERLRHVHVSDYAIFIFQDDGLESSSELVNLVTLSSVVLPYGEKTSRIMRQLPNLRKLRCIILESWDKSQECNQYPSLDILTRLESLKMSYIGRALHPGQFNFPVNLKKLTLSNFCLPWNYMTVIAKLQNLKVLKLLPRAFEGEKWDMGDDEFSKLKFLKLDTLNIVEWNATSDHFPNLQQLVLRSCKQLQAVPSTLGEIPTLEVIEVQWCGESVEESARIIREEADEKLKVFINFSE